MTPSDTGPPPTPPKPHAHLDLLEEEVRRHEDHAGGTVWNEDTPDVIDGAQVEQALADAVSDAVATVREAGGTVDEHDRRQITDAIEAFVRIVYSNASATPSWMEKASDEEVSRAHERVEDLLDTLVRNTRDPAPDTPPRR